MNLRNEHFQNAARGPLKYVGPGPSAPHPAESAESNGHGQLDNCLPPLKLNKKNSPGQMEANGCVQQLDLRQDIHNEHVKMEK